jgi:arsenate reductase
MITIYHNPRCSKSRAALLLSEQFAAARQLPLTVVDYQKTPLTLAQLHTLQQQLGQPLRAMVRDNEDEYAALQLQQAGDAALLQALAAHPRLLQRPIVVYQDRAQIGRPPEALHALLKD